MMFQRQIAKSNLLSSPNPSRTIENKLSASPNVLLYSGAAVLVWDASLSGWFGWAGVGFASCLFLGTNWISPRQQMLKPWHRALIKYGPAALLFLSALAIFWIVIMSDSANAQFFKNAETWMKTNFGKAIGGGGGAGGAGGGGDVISLVFNVLRAIYILYLGVELVKCIKAAQQDQDWQTLARTPLIIVVSITIADIVSTLILGSGTGGGAGGA
ncbi:MULTISPECIES: hypothetical protein [unclassified Microcoleus]|uniref:hypothetical protein n=2 Tax=unclassified Microcoleus TaxID=2642155 RepID=UPI001D6E5FB5|nr:MULTISPECIES: hypothetical protein [unclassified Microcoleus]MCC3473813.1 hypothetical protein [Microcoleus sp. PH2017_13_LAR_U_A]MCC3567510.1 hypothetical protein [Microcoleus sp. PH2017_31_RDM_U_A]MCC3626815.1 hypothetical protein [Microcoleus sp. PH2017_36_ELK_O_B]